MQQNMKHFKSNILKFKSMVIDLLIMIRNKCKANEDVMKAAAEKRRQEKKSNMRHHYEQLCQTQIAKSYLLKS